ncbi:DUF932 domain-containing protein [Amycolatopsis sp. NPDC051071]|uniref:DUF932 domain-containing protein n=1 Tax=Amycolatopsis sp. NPDC051071 TaxID=3154637 RepID=UPI003431DAA6
MLPKVRDAWCTLATQVNGSRTAAELVAKAGLKDWDVRPEPAFAFVPTGACVECGKAIGVKHKAGCFLGEAEPGEEFDGKVDENDTTEPMEVPGYYALVRTNPSTGRREAIGGSARQFTPAAIEDRAQMLTDMAKQLNAKYGAAGPLWSNTAGFVSIRQADPIKVGKADELEMRVVVVCSLLPGKSSQVLFSPVRPASATVQHFGLAPQNLDAVSNPSSRLSEGSQAIAAAQAAVDEITERAGRLLAAKMTLTAFGELCNELWKPPSDTANTWLKEQHKVRKSMLEMLFFGDYDMFAGIGRTRWAAWQAIQTVAEHMPHVPIKDDDKDAEVARRAEQALFGRSASIAAEALRKLEK